MTFDDISRVLAAILIHWTTVVIIKVGEYFGFPWFKVYGLPHIPVIQLMFHPGFELPGKTPVETCMRLIGCDEDDVGISP